MNTKNFEELCMQYGLRGKNGIGTLGEKGIHAVLKNYYQPDETLHEIHIGPYVADAVTGDGMILEIQTQAFSSMKKKLDAFLNSYEVTIIYPVASVRWVSHFDPESGVLSGRRKDRRHADEWQIFQELMSIREYLRRPNLHFLIALLQTEEYRMKGDRRNARYDRLPTALLKEVGIFSLRDYAHFLPNSLPTPFTTTDLSRCAGVSKADAQKALYTLNWAGAVERTGKRGNSHLDIKNPTVPG